MAFLQFNSWFKLFLRLTIDICFDAQLYRKMWLCKRSFAFTKKAKERLMLTLSRQAWASKLRLFSFPPFLVFSSIPHFKHWHVTLLETYPSFCPMARSNKCWQIKQASFWRWKITSKFKEPFFIVFMSRKKV